MGGTGEPRRPPRPSPGALAGLNLLLSVERRLWSSEVSFVDRDTEAQRRKRFHILGPPGRELVTAPKKSVRTHPSLHFLPCPLSSSHCDCSRGSSWCLGGPGGRAGANLGASLHWALQEELPSRCASGLPVTGAMQAVPGSSPPSASWVAEGFGRVRHELPLSSPMAQDLGLIRPCSSLSFPTSKKGQS